MKLVKLTGLAFKEGTDGAEDAFEKNTIYLDAEKVEQFFEHDIDRKRPIIGEVNRARAVSLMFSSGRPITVMEPLEEVAKILSA